MQDPTLFVGRAIYQLHGPSVETKKPRIINIKPNKKVYLVLSNKILQIVLLKNDIDIYKQDNIYELPKEARSIRSLQAG